MRWRTNVIDRLAAAPFGPRGLYETLVERVYLPVVDWRKKSGFGDAAREALGNQSRPRDELDALVLEKLRRILAHADTTCSFYGERFRAAGVDVSWLRTPEDMRRFPLVAKPDVAERRPPARAEAQDEGQT